MATQRRRRLEPRKKPVQQRSRATVDAILDAAARVFAASGYARTTTNHVARRAGVSIGSLYEYFPSKDALLVALTERHVDEAERVLGAELAAVRDAALTLAQVVRRLVDAMIGLHARDPGLHRVLFEEAPLPPRLRARVASLEEAMAGDLATLLCAHGLARTDARVAARLGVEVLESLTHRLVVHDAARGETGARQAEELTDLLLRYLEGKRRLVPTGGREDGRSDAARASRAH
jgi:AcrR family transcriptional regulator